MADPYADPDDVARPAVDEALRIVCLAMLDEKNADEDDALQRFESELASRVPSDLKEDVTASLAYLRDRVGVPRDMPLAAARHLRGYLNWAIDFLSY